MLNAYRIILIPFFVSGLPCFVVVAITLCCDGALCVEPWDLRLRSCLGCLESSVAVCLPAYPPAG